MKKYSTDYFEKKYKILSEKLLQKEGFIDAVKDARKGLDLPEIGFDTTQELAYFLIGKLSKSEQQSLTFFAFVEAYAYKNKISVSEDNREEIVEAFMKKELQMKCMTAFCESIRKSKLNYWNKCKTTLMQMNSSISLQI